MPLEALHPRPQQLLALARQMQAPRAVHFHLPRHLEEQPVALRRIRQLARLLVERVERLRLVAAVVALARCSARTGAA